MNRQIEILANKVKPKVSNDVLVREGWLDKRSERIYQSNVRCSTPSRYAPAPPVRSSTMLPPWEAVAVAEGTALAVPLGVAAAEAVGKADAVAIAVAVAEADAEPVADAGALAVADADAEPVALAVAAAVPEEDAVALPDMNAVAIAVSITDALSD